MIAAPSTILTSLLEKAAHDNGFGLELPRAGHWLAFSSSQCPLRIWLSTYTDAVILVAFSQHNVARALRDHGTPMTAPLPPGAHAGRTLTAISPLHQVLRRAFQLSKTLPVELLHVFATQTAALPRTTEVERLVVQRVGKDLFRQGLLDYWEGRCAVTGLAVPALLRASHIKPWPVCTTDAERLDVFNGLLLAPHLDAAFDRGFITVADDGAVIVADAVDPPARQVLGLARPLRVADLQDGHRAYLVWHRTHEFKAMASALPTEPQADVERV